MLRAWLRLMMNACGVAFVAAAAQLGVAQATGIIDWGAVSSEARWQTTLTWVAFIYLCAVLGGAAIGRRALRGRPERGRPERGRPERIGGRIASALAAGVGSALAISLAWLPAQSAHPPVSVHPELVVAMTAGVAIAAAVLLAVAALSLGPVAGSLRASVTWAWALAIACVIANANSTLNATLNANNTASTSTHSYPGPRLAMAHAPGVLASGWWTGPYLQVAVAALLGLVVAAAARWGGADRVAVAISGLTGPAAVAVAVSITGAQLAPLLAAGVGLVASALVAVVPRRKRKARGDLAAQSSDLFVDGTDGSQGADITATPSQKPAASTSTQKTPAAAATNQPAMPNQRRGRRGKQSQADLPAWGMPDETTAAQPVVARASVGPAGAGAAAAPSTGASGAHNSTSTHGSTGAAGVYIASTAAPAIGRPPRSTADDDYRDWISGLGREAPSKPRHGQ